MITRFLFCSVLCIACSFSAKASFCTDWIYKGEHINLYLCQNHSNFNKVRGYLFDGKAKYLDNYIADLISNKKLQDKKLEIQIYDGILTYTHLNISQNKNGYFVDMSGFPSLIELISIVNYFTQNDWIPLFFGEPYEEIGYQQIKRFYDKQRLNEIKVNDTLPFTVWEKDSIRLDYYPSKDQAYYYINDQKLDILANSSLPVTIKNRILLFEQGQILVMENNQIIRSFITSDYYMEDYDVYIYDKWINICIGGAHNWLYSYSYSKNRFIKRKDEKTSK